MRIVNGLVLGSWDEGWFGGLNHVDYGKSISNSKQKPKTHMQPSIYERISSWFSMAEGVWKVVAFLIVLAGGSTTAIIAKSTELFGRFGALGWTGVGIGAALILAIIVHLVANASLKTAEAEYVRAMSREKVSINPLSDSFVNQIIPIEDLRLPALQLHRNKQFKRCQFVGPGAIALLGGTISNNNFNECGDLVELTNGIILTGIVVLENCTIESSEFHKITVLTSKQMILALKGVRPVKETKA